MERDAFSPGVPASIAGWADSAPEFALSAAAPGAGVEQVVYVAGACAQAASRRSACSACDALAPPDSSDVVEPVMQHGALLASRGWEASVSDVAPVASGRRVSSASANAAANTSGASVLAVSELDVQLATCHAASEHVSSSDIALLATLSHAAASAESRQPDHASTQSMLRSWSMSPAAWAE